MCARSSSTGDMLAGVYESHGYKSIMPLYWYKEGINKMGGVGVVPALGGGVSYCLLPQLAQVQDLL